RPGDPAILGYSETRAARSGLNFVGPGAPERRPWLGHNSRHELRRPPLLRDLHFHPRPFWEPRGDPLEVPDRRPHGFGRLPQHHGARRRVVARQERADHGDQYDQGRNDPHTDQDPLHGSSLVLGSSSLLTKAANSSSVS